MMSSLDSAIPWPATANGLDFTAFHLAGSRGHAAFSVDRGGEVPAVRELVTRSLAVDPDALADEDVDLFDLLDPVAP